MLTNAVWISEHSIVATRDTVAPFACAAFLILAFILAGIVHTVWLRSRLSGRLAIPLDGGRTWRGQRVFGDNKTVRGFVAMLPAAAVSFCLLAFLVQHQPELRARMWPLSLPGYALLGLMAGLGFMLGELPNSRWKRQLGIPPGGMPDRWILRPICFAVDRLDSIAGMLLAVSLMAPTPWQTWLYVVLLGPAVHWLFSAVLFWLGVKSRLS